MIEDRTVVQIDVEGAKRIFGSLQYIAIILFCILMTSCYKKGGVLHLSFTSLS
jgi:hypothetical protein